VIKVATAISYLEKRGLTAAVEVLKNLDKGLKAPTYKGSSGSGKNRSAFGKVVNAILDKMTPEERVASVRVFDCDLEGSCGLDAIHKAHPEVFIAAGIMERGNFSAAAGFGFEAGKQGIFGTFSAFLEMIISHFSHAGCDDMADNTCHFGINNLFAANGLPDDGKDTTRVYFPADQHQFAKCVTKVFGDPGLRFVFSTRSAVPDILNDNGDLLFGDGYEFAVGKDDIVREGTAGYVVSFGDTLYRALDAVITLKEQGIDVGLINKTTLNVMDETMMAKLAKAPAVMVVESFNVNTGLGCKFGTELLKRGFAGKYNNIGINREGSGGLWQQHGYQGIDTDGIQQTMKTLLGK
jgi:transketolase C-terminal domain/subunit